MKFRRRVSREVIPVKQFKFLDDIPRFLFTVERYDTKVRRPPFELSNPIRDG